jgi:cytochrome c553
MKSNSFRYVACMAGIALVTAAALAQYQSAPATAVRTPPAWAYVANPAPVPGAQPAHDDGSAKHLPGSSAAFTLSQIRDLFSPPDWYPDSHPAMPESVAHGRKPDVRPCGYCHLPNGLGRPENASLAGLPAAYIVQQMADYKAGLRNSSEPRLGPATFMLAIGKNANDAEVNSAAEYFSSLKPKPWIRVVETATVPKSKAAGSMLVAVEGGGKEPIGNRIIETAEDLERTELRDSTSGFVAYVPLGSLKKGEALVTGRAGNKTIRCAICHGTELKGLGRVPSIAGRSPSYIVRQMYDIQNGARNGPWTELMKDTVARLSVDDMVSIAAYTASRMP